MGTKRREMTEKRTRRRKRRSRKNTQRDARTINNEFIIASTLQFHSDLYERYKGSKTEWGEEAKRKKKESNESLANRRRRLKGREERRGDCQSKKKEIKFETRKMDRIYLFLAPTSSSGATVTATAAAAAAAMPAETYRISCAYKTYSK